MLFLIFGIVAVVLVLAAVLREYLKVQHALTNTTFKNSPVQHGPWKFPLGDFIEEGKDYMRFVKNIRKAVKETTGAWMLIYGSSICITSLVDKELLRSIFGANDLLFRRDNSSFPIIHRLLDNSILGVDGEEWRFQHRLFSKFFTVSMVKNYRPVFVENLKEIFSIIDKQLDENGGEASIEIYSLMKEFTNKVTCDVLFGADVNAKDRETFMNALDAMLMHTHYLCHNLPFFGTLFWFLPVVREVNAIFNTINDVSKKILSSRRNALTNENYTPSCIVDHMLTASDDATGKGLSEEKLIGNIRAMMFAGTDTTATALAWFLVHASRTNKKDMYDLLMKEVNSLDNLDLDGDDYGVPLKESYLFAFLNETLRLSSPVSGTPLRIATKDLDVGDLHVPKGMGMGVSASLYHRLPFIWKDPDTFNPDRFLNRYVSLSAVTSDYDFVTFGAGRRNCIGRYLAYEEMLSALPRFLSRYDVVQDDEDVAITYNMPMVVPEDGQFFLKLRTKKKHD
eukprot:m.6618 g.6618  ORF g.6618 m.6618 type:complete len:509 (+) comp2622_c0_seq1:344-1870(+)